MTMRIIKKYNQYLKGSKISKMNENFNEVDDTEINTDDIESSNMNMSGNNTISPETSSEFDESQEEEEGNQYLGNKMLKELANKLGTSVTNNSINYKGKKINFFSETEMYHVDRKKFKTSEEVINYLNDLTDDNNSKDKEMTNGDIEEPMMMEKRSYRKSRKFEPFRNRK
jgi:hypothetical protein